MVIDRIHDRVPKTNKEGDYWEISRSSETKGDKKRDEEQGRRRREQDAFGESSDFIQLLTKDPRTYKREKLDTARISQFTFRGVSTHREKAILEVDIRLKDGTLIRSAQLAISRTEGMKFISRKPGDDILVEPLIQGATHLTIALPQKPGPPRAAPRAEEETGDGAMGNKKVLEWYYYLLFGILGLSILAMVYVFIMG